MYSRDIFPKYTSGGLPIPENYSGHAIRRMPQSGHAAGGRENGRENGQSMPLSTPRVHMPAPRGGGIRTAEVPLSVTPSFAARNGLREAAQGETGEEALPHGKTWEDESRRDVEPRGEDAAKDGQIEEREAVEKRPENAEADDRAEKEAAVPTSAQGGPPRPHEGGLGSILSTLLPPKFGGGALSQVGLEEALLLGLFLLLSQSEEEDDTLMLLALLFLYR